MVLLLFCVFTVGLTGQHTLTECGADLEQAKQLFKKK